LGQQSDRVCRPAHLASQVEHPRLLLELLPYLLVQLPPSVSRLQLQASHGLPYQAFQTPIALLQFLEQHSELLCSKIDRNPYLEWRDLLVERCRLDL
jgi:hypothetical protein